jgi:hypothetical protein
LLCRLATHQFVEVAALSACRRFLKQQRQPALVEFIKPLVPGNLFERAFATITWKIDAQNADVAIASGVSHARGAPAALLRPCANLIVIGSRSTAC